MLKPLMEMWKFMGPLLLFLLGMLNLNIPRRKRRILCKKEIISAAMHTTRTNEDAKALQKEKESQKRNERFIRGNWLS